MSCKYAPTIILSLTLKSCLVDPDPTVRFVAGDTMGRVCSYFTDAHIAKQIKVLTDSVVANREPNARAGFAFALGSILYYLGGMAAGLHLRAVLSLLLSLANDPHPIVHFWAAEALEKTINSSGLNFSAHVSSCLGAISRLVLSDVFDPEDVVTPMSNTAMEVPTLACLMRGIDAIINVLGPDLMSSKRSRLLICMLVRETALDADLMVSMEAIRCMRHLYLFVPDALDLRRFIHRLETNLSNSVPQIRQLSCEALYELIRKDVQLVFENAHSSLPDELWSLLNFHSNGSGDVEQLILSWLEQTAVTDVKRWIEMCLKLLTRSGRSQLLKVDSKGESVSGDGIEFIDEAAAFSSQSANKTAQEDTYARYLPWQTISFALSCLRRVVELNLEKYPMSSDGRAHPLVLCVGDLIRAAFTASTSIVVDIRLGGLNLLHDLIKVIQGSTSC